MCDELMLHGVLNMPLPDDPAECDIVTWVQFKHRAREASARIVELETKLAYAKGALEAIVVDDTWGLEHDVYMMCRAALRN